MVRITLYLADDCATCEEYINALILWTDILSFEFESITMIQENVKKVFIKLRKLREDGHDIQMFPFLVVEKDGLENVYTGILTPEEVASIMQRYE